MKTVFGLLTGVLLAGTLLFGGGSSDDRLAWLGGGAVLVAAVLGVAALVLCLTFVVVDRSYGPEIRAQLRAPASDGAWQLCAPGY